MASQSNALRRIIRAAAVLSVLLLLPRVAMIAWMQSRGDWHLSASNMPDGVDVRVYWGNSDTPTYSTKLAGRSIPREINRVTREQLPDDVATTTFYDVTMRPGRWTIVIDGIELDIMEAGWTVDGVADRLPKNTTEQ